MYAVSGPKRLQFGSRIALLWVVTLDGVPHRVAWLPGDGGLKLSYPVDDEHWSAWLRLGDQYSPRRSLAGAQKAVIEWATAQCERHVGRHTREHAGT